MATDEQQERRFDRTTELHVNAGVSVKSISGIAIAREYMAAYGISAEVISRVLFGQGPQRRRTSGPPWPFEERRNISGETS
jgi:hypothetical protein